jgi:hypothetical protein
MVVKELVQSCQNLIQIVAKENVAGTIRVEIAGAIQVVWGMAIVALIIN